MVNDDYQPPGAICVRDGIVLIWVAALMAGLTACVTPVGSTAVAGSATVVKVVDGDTILAESCPIRASSHDDLSAGTVPTGSPCA